LLVKTRRATQKDLDELFKIERECFRDEAFNRQQLAYFLNSPFFLNVIAEVDGEVAGFVVGVIEFHGPLPLGHIYSIDVSKRYRRMGVATRLLGEIERLFVERGVRFSYLEVRVDNAAARRLYEKCGYKEVEILQDYYKLGVHGVRLRKDLKTSKLCGEE